MKSNPIYRIDRRMSRKSLMAQAVADEVKATIRAGKKVNLTQIQMRNGYSAASARSGRALKTKTYKTAMADVISSMKRIHAKALEDLEARDFSTERMDSVVGAAKQMVHDTQLLQGRATENLATNVVVYGSEDFLALQKGQAEPQASASQNTSSATSDVEPSSSSS